MNEEMNDIGYFNEWWKLEKSLVYNTEPRNQEAESLTDRTMRLCQLKSCQLLHD